MIRNPLMFALLLSTSLLLAGHRTFAETSKDHLKKLCPTFIQNMRESILKLRNQDTLDPDSPEESKYLSSYNFVRGVCRPNEIESQKDATMIYRRACLKKVQNRETLARKLISAASSTDDQYLSSYFDLQDSGGFSTTCKYMEQESPTLARLNKNADEYKKKFKDAIRKHDYSLPKKSCGNAFVDTRYFPKNNNQMSLQWCHAMVAAKLLSFKSKLPLSAYDLAIQALSDDDSDKQAPLTEMGSSPEEDITAAVDSAKGICTEDSLKVDDESWGKLSDAIYGIGKDKTLSMKTLPCSEPAFAHGFDKLTDFLLGLVNNLSPRNRLGALMDLQCGKRVKIAPETSEKLQTINQAESRNLFGEIDQQLSLSEPNPIGISIQSKDFFPGYDGNHALIIVGRSYNDKTNQCEYLIENSWGNNCNSVKTSDEVRCAENNKALWVGRQYLLSHLLDITYLEK